MHVMRSFDLLDHEARSRKRFHCTTGDCVQDARSEIAPGLNSHSDGREDQVSQQRCTERTKMASPATMAEFDFETSDGYDVSVVEGFNVNISIVPSSSSCPSTQCKTHGEAVRP